MIFVVFLTLVLGIVIVSFLKRSRNQTPEQPKQDSREERKPVTTSVLARKYGLEPAGKKNVTFSLTLERLKNLMESEIAVLEQLSTEANLLLIFEAKEDEEERNIKQLVTSKIPFLGDKLHHILFHETSKGKIAFCRQLKSQIHIEHEQGIVKELLPHIPHIFLLLSNPSLAIDLTSVASIRRVDHLSDL